MLGERVEGSQGRVGRLGTKNEFRCNYRIFSDLEREEVYCQEIKRLEKEKQRLKARIDAIERLQGNRPLIVRLFDEMVTSLPEGVSIKSVKQSGKKITIAGVAQSNARVSSFMRKLEDSDWLGNPQLDVIQARDEQGHRLSNLTMRFNQVIPKTSSEEDDA